MKTSNILLNKACNKLTFLLSLDLFFMSCFTRIYPHINVHQNAPKLSLGKTKEPIVSVLLLNHYMKAKVHSHA